MKKIISIAFAVLALQTVSAQQRTADYITNSYIDTLNVLNTVDAVNDLRNSIYQSQFGKNFPLAKNKISNNSAYYKIFYKKNTPAVKEAILSIQCSGAELGAVDFDTSFERYFSMFALESEDNEFSKKVIKTTAYNAGYFFQLADNRIYILIYSKGKPGMVRASIDVHLSTADKETLAEDFIANTVFIIPQL